MHLRLRSQCRCGNDIRYHKKQLHEGYAQGRKLAVERHIQLYLQCPILMLDKLQKCAQGPLETYHSVHADFIHCSVDAQEVNQVRPK